MSDRDNTPDPIDLAYARAEALLVDDAARAARRARVLAAVARDLSNAAPTTGLVKRRFAWSGGGWLAAAGVVGLSVIVATQLYPPSPRPEGAKSTFGADRVIAHPATTPLPTRSAPARIQIRPSRPAPKVPPAIAVTSAIPPPAASFVAPPPPLYIAPPAPAPAPPPVAAPAPPPPAAVASEFSGSTPTSRATSFPIDGLRDRRRYEAAAKLRAFAASGRTAEVETLLAQGVPVDDPDEDGETALMKSIEADRPAVAALLRRRGASLDIQNHAGESARDMAVAKGNVQLEEAIGLGP